jgi:diguanylate cyclase (GGDEF)-like protein
MNQQILVIDDSPAIHPLIKAILADEPVDIHTATDPEYGLVLAASIRPDLILLDVDMPGMDGFVACERLKADLTTAVCTIIFLSSHASMADKVHGFGLGAIDYVSKPFVGAELLARVRASLRTSRVVRMLGAKATIDPLTGLGNSAMFVQRIEAEIALRSRIGNPLSIILMDVDQFKEIDEAHGHNVGFQILQSIGKIVGELCRKEDVACRIEGDQFAIIMPHTPSADAVVFAERIRGALANVRITSAGVESAAPTDECIRVTGSFVVADAVGPHDRSLLERAKDAMSRAKTGGRDRVLTASRTIEPQLSAA